MDKQKTRGHVDRQKTRGYVDRQKTRRTCGSAKAGGNVSTGKCRGKCCGPAKGRGTCCGRQKTIGGGCWAPKKARGHIVYRQNAWGEMLRTAKCRGKCWEPQSRNTVLFLDLDVYVLHLLLFILNYLLFELGIFKSQIIFQLGPAIYFSEPA